MSNDKKEPSIHDYIAAQDAENGTNLSAWLTPQSPAPDDANERISAMNAQALANATQRIDAVKNGAVPRTESEREFARINKMIRKFEKPSFMDKVRAMFKSES